MRLAWNQLPARLLFCPDRLPADARQRPLKQIVSLLLAASLVFGLAESAVLAWEQPAHREINRRAIELFEGSQALSAKYRNASFQPNAFSRAPVVTTSGKFSLTYNQRWSLDQNRAQIIAGGFSADEPNVYVSMKHFYDPLALSGVHELTDQDSAHGLVYEAIPATEWAVFRQDNPYSLLQAMLNYKASLEIPYTAEPADLPATGDFRDLAGTPADLTDMRQMYLGKAMRGLGETMHLVADMTQPAHVRNDSHPRYEITEQAITGPLASALLTFPRSDGVSVAGLGDLTTDIMVHLATWTNAHFFSQDTIADSKLGLKPANWEKPYAAPRLSALTTGTLNGYETWFASFSGKSVPMVRKEPGIFYDAYDITPEMAIRQAEVLLPLAAAADASVIDQFLPTLVLSQTVTEVAADPDLTAQAKQAGVEELKVYAAAISLTHQTASDPQWRQMGLTIRYSGPGTLWRTRKGKSTKISDVEFVDGQVVACQDPETGEMVAEKPRLILALGAPDKLNLSGPAVDYSIEMDDGIYATVEAGARKFLSDPYVFAQNESTIQLKADRTTIMPGEKITFTAEIDQPPERYELEWDFGDADPEATEAPEPVRTRKTTVAHTFEREQDYTVTVRLIDRKRKIVRAEDTLTVSAEFGELAGNWSIVMTVQEENAIFRNFLVAFMKGIIRLVISPIAEALEAGPIDPSVVDNFTFVGTTLEYETDLTRDKAKAKAGELVYHGPLTFVGSNKDYIEGSAGLNAVTVVLRDGLIVFLAEATGENGTSVSFPYLQAGRLVGDDRMTGTFNLEGSLSGTWVATR